MAEREMCKCGVYKDCHDDRVLAIQCLPKQITTLRTQLKKHGGHTAECARRQTIPYGATDIPECDCGWAEIEKGLLK